MGGTTAAAQTITSGALSATIEPQGAQLTSLKLAEVEYLWQADARWWGRSAPVLFPIVGNLRNDSATSAQGPCRMGRHGIARTREHELVENTGSSVTFRLESDAATREAYPYGFRLEMSYALEGPSTLAQTFAVTNTGEVTLPFSLGGHPAFNVPLCEGERWEDYALVFSRPWTASTPIIVEGGLWDYGTQIPLLTESERLPLSRSLFDYDTTVLEGVPDSTVTLVGPAGHGVRVDFEGFEHLGIWSAAANAQGEGAPFLAVEPWCGTATRADEDDVFEHKQNLLAAAPGQTITRTFRMTLL